MSATLAVFRRELLGHFDSLVALVTTALFVVALDALFFFVGYAVGDLRVPSFWVGREATLRALFAWLPLLFVVLVPALTMGAWAEERRAGTEELLLTLPITTRAAVLGKFLSAWTLVVVLLVVAVVPVAAVVASLGPLDWGTVWGGLVGAAALAATCTALALWISALTGDQLIAFLVAAVLLGAFQGAGLLATLLPADLAALVHYANPATHFLDSAALGVLDLRDGVYHALLVALGLWLCVAAVERRRTAGGGR